MTIDIHVHNYAVDQTVAAAGRNQVDFLVFLGSGSRFGVYPDTAQIQCINNETLETVRRFPDSSCGFCCLNPANPLESLQSELHRCLELPEFRGVKLGIAVNCRSQKLDPVMEMLEEFDVPLLHHCWYKTVNKYPNESDPSDIADLARRFPQVKIIMAHLTGCGIRGIEDIATLPNVWVDTSGGQPEAGFIEYAIKRIGAKRIVYGSDAPLRDFCSQLAKIHEADISDAERKLIFSENARELLNL